MTIRLQIDVNAEGLVSRNLVEQNANRQAALVKAQAEQAAAKGAEQQGQRRSSLGLDPATGRPFFSSGSTSRATRLSRAGSTSRLTRIDQEPAAFRGDQIRVAYCGLGFSSRTSDASKVYIWPRNAAEPTVFDFQEGFNYETVISTITGEPLSSSVLDWVRFPEWGDDAYSDGFSVPEAWSPQLPEFNYLGGLLLCSSASTPIPVGEYGGGEWYKNVYKETFLENSELAVNTSLFLPVGNDLGILVLRRWDIRNQYVYYSDQYNKDTVFSYWPFTDAQGDPKVYLGLNQEYSFSYTVTPYQHEIFFSQCYLVSPNSVKPIAMPGALESIMETWNPFPTYEEQNFDLNDGDTSLQGLFYGVEGVSTCTGTGDSHGDGIVSTVATAPKSYTARVYDNPERIDLSAARLRINYGFSVLSTSYPTSQPIGTSFSSPVLYSFISDPSAMTVDSDPLNTDYAHIKSVYPEVSTLRKFISPQVVETASAFRLQIHQAISSPESANTPVPTRPVSRGSWFNIPQKPEDYNSSWRHYMTWDWEKPGYCRSKALDLGFSPEDLKP